MDSSQRYRGRVILAVTLLCIALQTAPTLAQSQCTYQYIEQPPTAIICNPYGDGNDDVLMIKCALTAPVGSSITINWFHRGTTQITEGIVPTMNTDNAGTDTFQSILSLTEPDPTTDSGDYVCQAEIDGSNLLPSDPFTLSDDQGFNINEQPCSASEPAQFKMETKCADVTATEPPITEFVSTQPPTTPPPVTTQPITPSQTTPSTSVTPSLVLSETPTLGSTIPTTEEEDTRTQTTDQGTQFTNGPIVPESLQVWIYVLVGVAAVFGMIIIILSIMCVGMCLKRNKTGDMDTLKRNGNTGMSGQFSSGSMVPNELYHSTDAISAPPRYPGDYSTLGECTYEAVSGFADSNKQYSHLHRPSPPPLPPSLPNGRSATMGGSPPNSQFRSMSTLTSESMGVIPSNKDSFVTAALPQTSVPEHHVYRELENPGSLSYSPKSSPPNSASLFERGDSSTQLIPGPLSKAFGGPYRKYSSDSAQSSNLHESLYSPTTPLGSFTASGHQAGLEDIPETGMTFSEPSDPSAFPVHEYEVIPGSAKTKKYETAIPSVEERQRVGANPQTRVSVKSCNYETDPKLDLAIEGTTDQPVSEDLAVGFSINSLSTGSSLNTSSAELRGCNGVDDTSDIRGLKPSTMETNASLSSTSTRNFNAEYEPDYSRLVRTHNKGPDKLSSREQMHNGLDAEFFKGASEIHLSNANGSILVGVRHSDRGSRDSSPSTPKINSFTSSTPVSPPAIYPTTHIYNQLTLPSFQQAYRAGSKTTV